MIAFIKRLFHRHEWMTVSEESDGESFYFCRCRSCGIIRLPDEDKWWACATMGVDYVPSAENGEWTDAESYRQWERARR